MQVVLIAGEAQAQVRVSGPFNPDVLSDMTNRCLELIGAGVEYVREDPWEEVDEPVSTDE